MRASSVMSGMFAATFGLVVLSGCATGSTAQSQSSGSPSARGGSGQAIKIGIDLPVSGADASTGIPTQNGAVLAIEQANAHGLPGGFTLSALTLDDAVQGVHDPAQGAQNVKTFISDPSVVAMIGPFNSNVAKAEIPLTNDAGLAQVSPANTSTGLTKGDDAAKLRTSHPDVNAYFRVSATDDRQGAAGARFARALGFRSAFVIDDDETYGKGLADVFAQQFVSLGGTVLGHEHLTKGQQDFKALLTKARSVRPDMVFYGGTTASGGGLLRRQMGDAGMAATPFVGGDGIADAEFLHSAGTLANGSYFTVAAPEASKLPAARAFLREYEARWKAPVGPYSANAYAVARLEIAAIEKAIVDGGGKPPTRAAVLRNVAATSHFASPIGPIGFDRNGDTTDPILTVYGVKGGRFVFVNQIDLRS